MAGKLKIILKRSRIGRSKHQHKVLDGLGLRRRHQEIELKDTPAIRGMVKKVEFMLDVKEC